MNPENPTPSSKSSVVPDEELPEFMELSKKIDAVMEYMKTLMPEVSEWIAERFPVSHHEGAANRQEMVGKISQTLGKAEIEEDDLKALQKMDANSESIMVDALKKKKAVMEKIEISCDFNELARILERMTTLMKNRVVTLVVKENPAEPSEMESIIRRGEELVKKWQEREKHAAMKK